MIPVVELGPDFHQAHFAYRQAVSRWAPLLSRHGELRRLDACDNAYQAGLDLNHVYLVQAGSLASHRGEKKLWHWSEGDLIGLPELSAGMEVADEERLCIPEFALLVAYPRASLEQLAIQDPVVRSGWIRILSLQARMASLVVARLAPAGSSANPGFQRFARGEVIIRQGDEAEYVYTLIEGAADVYVDEVKVGGIASEEIFGALAMLTGGRRSATVIATAPCTLMMVHRDDFFSMVKTHPHLFMALMQDMAFTILGLNSQVVDHKVR